MKAKLKRALELARDEAMDGRNVMVLIPDVFWWAAGKSLTYILSDDYGSVHIQRSSHHSGLKMVAIDTLIMVAPDDPTWDAKGEALARERLRTSLDPRVIKVGEKT